MSDWTVIPGLVLAVSALSVLAIVLAAAFFRLRRRHRDCRHELARVARERDRLKRQQIGMPLDHGPGCLACGGLGGTLTRHHPLCPLHPANNRDDAPTAQCGTGVGNPFPTKEKPSHA